MTSSKILFYLCLSFIAGIFLESVIKIPQIFLWAFLFADIIAVIIFLFLDESNFIIFGFCFLFLVIGILRFQISEFNIASDRLSRLNGNGQKIVLTGVINTEPDIRDTSQNLKVKVPAPGGSALGGDYSIILVTTNRYPEYNYLDKIQLTGKLEAPMETDDFSYKNYLMKDGVYSVMGFPKILVLGSEKPNVFEKFYSGILFLKDKLRKSIRSNFSPPQSLILEGTVLGNNGVMSDDLKNKLNITGLRHVIAVSGTHIVILSAILMSFLLMLGFYRNQAFYFSVALIWLYIILTGLNASGIRAGIMGSLFMLAQKLGRQSVGLRTIAIAGAVMLLQNPLLLFYDIGFQLSFLAALGIIFLTPIFTLFFNFIRNKFLLKNNKDSAGSSKELLSILSSTFSAQIFTLPIILYSFGNVSLTAPITNLLILPTVPLMMGFGFVCSIIGIFSQTLGFITSIPCWILLTYFLKVMDIFSQPWAMKTCENVHWAWLIILYVIIIFTVRFLTKKYLHKFV